MRRCHEEGHQAAQMQRYARSQNTQDPNLAIQKAGAERGSLECSSRHPAVHRPSRGARIHMQSFWIGATHQDRRELTMTFSIVGDELKLDGMFLMYGQLNVHGSRITTANKNIKTSCNTPYWLKLPLPIPVPARTSNLVDTGYVCLCPHFYGCSHTYISRECSPPAFTRPTMARSAKCKH